jgi:hypothetical protein
MKISGLKLGEPIEARPSIQSDAWIPALFRGKSESRCNYWVELSQPFGGYTTGAYLALPAQRLRPSQAQQGFAGALAPPPRWRPRKPHTKALIIEAWNRSFEVKATPVVTCPFCSGPLSPCTTCERPDEQGELVYSSDRLEWCKDCAGRGKVCTASGTELVPRPCPLWIADAPTHRHEFYDPEA